MRYTKTVVVAVCILVLGAMGAAISEDHRTGVAETQVGTSTGDLSFTTENTSSSLFDNVFSFLFSGVGFDESVVNPGETLNAAIEVDVTSFSDNAVEVMTIYNCGDSDCSNPPEIDVNNDGLVDSCQLEGDVRDGKDDCIAIKSKETTLTSSLKLFNAEWQVPSDADLGQYVAQGYVYDTETNSFISDAPTEQFTVEAADSDPTDPTRPDSPDINGVTQPDVDATSDEVTAEVVLENQGADMTEPYIVEMQVRPSGQQPLSFVSRLRTCDPSHPENVNREFELGSGERETVTLSVPVDASTELEPETEYTVWLITQNGCSNTEGGGVDVEPYDTGFSRDVVTGADTPENGGPTAALIIGGALLVVGGAWVMLRG